MIKVINVVADLDISSGGPSRSVPQTCEQLADLGIDIQIFARPSKTPVKIKSFPNLRVQFLSIWALMKFGRCISKSNVDLIHLQHVWDPYLHIMAWWARKKNIPYIITPRGMLEPWLMKQRTWKKKMGLYLYQRKDLKKASMIHATCELEKSNIIKLGFKNPIKIIPNGVDLSKVTLTKSIFGSKKIVFLSRIHPKKGLELLLNAWRNIKTEGWTLEIAGNGDKHYIESLKYTARDMNNVAFVGPKFGEDKWSYIRSGDIFILPTFSENFGIVVAEALASGVPVITTTGTPWNDLNENNCGWHINLNLKNLQSTIQEAMSLSDKELKTMGLNGKKLIKDKYDMKNVGYRMKQLYYDVLDL